MAEPMPPYNLSYPDGFDDPADFPNLLQQNLQVLSQMVVGQFDTQASAQAALGSSSSSPIFYTTTNPTTLWCLDASGATEVWTLGGAYNTAPFVITDNNGTTFSLGASQRYLSYRVEGAHCYGWGEVIVGNGVAWPAVGNYFWFPVPFPAQNRISQTQMSVGSVQVTMAGLHYAGVTYIASGSSHCLLYINDLSRQPASTLRAVGTVTGSGGTTQNTWAAGDTIRYSFAYERQV